MTNNSNLSPENLAALNAHRQGDGKFGAHSHTDPDTTLAGPQPERSVPNTDLQPGDVLISDQGERTTVQDVSPSSTMPGFMAVETGFGTLYLPNELESMVAAEDEMFRSFKAGEMPAAELRAELDAARQNPDIRLVGPVYTADAVNDFVNGIVDHEEFYGLSEGFLQEHGDEVVKTAVKSNRWDEFGHTVDSDAREMLEELVLDAAAEVQRRVGSE